MVPGSRDHDLLIDALNLNGISRVSALKAPLFHASLMGTVELCLEDGSLYRWILIASVCLRRPKTALTHWLEEGRYDQDQVWSIVTASDDPQVQPLAGH